MFKTLLSFALFTALLAAMPAQASFLVTRDGKLPAAPVIIHAVAAPQAEPLLAAVPAEPEIEIIGDTSSDAPGSGFMYTAVIDTNAAERLPGATSPASGGGGAYSNTSGYDNFNAFHDAFATPAEAVYHSQGSPANYRGAPYQNYRGYGNVSGYTNNYGGYNNYYGYRGGYSY
jgi:hypothetical protein